MKELTIEWLQTCIRLIIDLTSYTNKNVRKMKSDLMVSRSEVARLNRYISVLAARNGDLEDQVAFLRRKNDKYGAGLGSLQQSQRKISEQELTQKLEILEKVEKNECFSNDNVESWNAPKEDEVKFDSTCDPMNKNGKRIHPTPPRKEDE